uniref:Cadherin domain-containing protein n=1 Tax=Curvibacter symbiont subsp. Hydra magnipapillata TaxID=667019 RepID=C9Y8W5_CURXX|nr:hypothetical protein Csp_A05660 [Curvibacter putative symbiont of Hydra magnipapillata]
MADAASGNLNVNPMTTMAAQKLGVSAQVETAPKTTTVLKTEDVAATNKAVAKALGVVDGTNQGLDIATAPVTTVITTTGSANANANAYGKALAVISQMEKVGVLSTTEVIAKITEAIDTTAGSLTNTTTSTAQTTTATQTLLVQALVETAAKGQINTTEVASLVQSSTGTTMATVTDNATEVTGFTALQVAALTAADVAKLSATQVLALGDKLAQLSDSALVSLNATQLAQISGAQVTALGTKVFSLSKDAVVTANITAINNALTAAMPDKAAGIAALGSKLGNLSDATLAALSNDQVAGITATQLGALTGAQVNALGTKLAQLSDTAVANLSTTQLGAITTLGNLGSKVFSLSTTAISAVADKTAITTAQTTELAKLTTAGSVTALGSKIATLTDGALFTLNATQAGGLSPLQIQALSSNQLAQLSTTAFAALSPTAIASLSASQLGALTGPQLGVLTADQMTALSVTQVQSLSSTALANLSNDAAGALSGNQLAGMNNAQLTGLGTKITAVPFASYVSLSQAQLDLLASALGSSTVTAIKNDQAAAGLVTSGTNVSATDLGGYSAAITSALSPTVIGQLSTTAIASLKTEGLTSAQAAVLSTAQIGALSTNQITAFSPSALASLSTNAVASLATNQIGALTAAQVAQLTAAQIQALGTKVASLSVDAIASLSNAAIAGLEAAQLTAITGPQAAKLTASQMAALSATQVAQLGTAAVAQLSASALAQLSATQVRALTGDQAAVLTTTQIDALSPAQVASLSPTAVAKLSTGVNSALQSLDDSQLAALTASQAAALTGTQVADLGAKLLKLSNTALSQISASNTDAMTALSGQITSLTASQVKALSPAQVANLTLTGLSATDLGNFNTNLTSTQAKALTAGQLATLSVVTLATSLTDNVEPVGTVASPATVSAGGTTNDTTPTFSGTVTRLPAGAVVAIYDTVSGGTAQKIGEATVSGTGWTFTPSSPMTAQGGHSITARVEVTGGSSSTPTAALAFTLDTVDDAGTVSVTNTTDGTRGTTSLQQGDVLTAGTPVDADGGVTGVTYQWKAGGVNVAANGTGSTYTLTQADVGKAITVVATYTDALGPNKTATSTPTGNVVNVDDAGTVSVTNTTDGTRGTTSLQQGDVLTAGTPVDADGGVTGVTYQWKAGGVNVAANGTGSTYTLTQADVGKAITVVATYTDALGPNKTATSTPTGNVVNVDDAGTVSVTNTTDGTRGTTSLQQGDVLTAGTPVDADGGVTGVTYQWKAGGVNVAANGTGSTYTLTQADVGKAITVVATYTDALGPNKTATSTPTGNVVNVDDAGTVSVTNTTDGTRGTTSLQQGDVLTAGTPVDADGGVTGVTYQWKAGGVNVAANGTGSTYTLTQADVGKAITVVATYTDALGPNKTATSTPTGNVVAPNDTAGTVSVTNTTDGTRGTTSLQQGDVLTAGTPVDADGGVTGVTYQWKAGGVNVAANGTGSTYTLTQADVGKAITVVATYTDALGPNKTATSTPTGNVVNVDDAGTVSVTNTTDGTRGTTSLQQGDVLTAGTPVDADGGVTGVTYQWKAGGVNVAANGTGSTYTLTQADVGKAITVVATYTDALGPNKTATSTPTGNVVNVDDAGTVSVTNTTDGTRGTTSLQQGDVLTAGTPVDADGGVTGVTYQWKAGGVNVAANGTGSTYTLTQADVGKAITVVATYTDALGPNKTATSTPTGNVVNVDDAGTVSVTNTTDGTRGTTSLQQGDVLTAGTPVDADGGVTGVTYQWKAGGVNVAANGTGSTYTLTQADVGKAITVVATYTDALGPNKTATSTPTGNVVNVDDAPTAINLNQAETYTKNTPLNLTDIVVTDVDSATVTVTLTLSNVAAGGLNTGTSGTVTSTYNAGSGVWTASGAIADVNTLLAALTFTPATDYVGSFNITTNVNDGTNTLNGSKAFTGIATNTVPTLTTVSTLTGFVAGDAKEISYADLAAAANEADAENAAISFRIEALSTGTLEKWNGSTWATATPGTTTLSSGEKLRWTSAAGTSGDSVNAFTVKAFDGSLYSTSAVQVTAKVDGYIFLGGSGNRLVDDGWSTGSILQSADLGLSAAQLTALSGGSVKFTSLTNLKLYSLATAGNAASTQTEITAFSTTNLTYADIVSGKYLIKYSQSDEATAGRNALAALTVTPSSGGAYDKTLEFVISTATGVAAWGDESGFGGGVGSLSGGAGGAGADTLLGTTQSDIMFGDGSGGGSSDHTIASRNASVGGAGGGGADNLFAGAGDDILFGDGFTGGTEGQWGLNGGAGGYGGGGGGSAGMYGAARGVSGAGGVGAGSSGASATVTAGGSTTLGFTTAGLTGGGSGNATQSGVGAGVSADGNSTATSTYVAELDSGAISAAGQFNNTGTVSAAVAAARAAFLDGPGGSNAEDRLFTQTMGTGNDVIQGGSGADYIMAGNGNDVITGGQGNDIMYGRGGGALSGTDNDTYVWQRGDAGSAGSFDIVRDFTEWNSTTGDKLDLTQLLEGYTPGTSTLSNWVTVQTGVTGASLVGNGVISGSWDAGQTGTLITIDVDGTGGSGTATQRIFLAGTTLSSTSAQALAGAGVLVVSVPTVQSFTVTDSTAGNGTQLGKSGEALTFVVTLSEPVTSTAGLTAVFTVNGQDVSATASAVTNSSTITFTGGSVPSTGDGTAISLKSLVASSGVITGNLSNQPMQAVSAGTITHADYRVDNTAPTLATTSYDVNESTTLPAANVSVATLAGSDATSMTYTLGSTGVDNTLFTLVNGVLKLKDGKSFEDTGTHSNTYNLTVDITDAAGNLLDEKAITVNLKDVNEAPVVTGTAIADVQASAGTAYTIGNPLFLNGTSSHISSYFTDPDTTGAFNTLTYTLGSGAPSWLQIDGSTGKLYGTAPATPVQDLPVTVNAFDGLNTVSKTFNIDVAAQQAAGPALMSTQALDNVSNLDVRSALVIAFDQNIALGNGQIRISDDMGTTGWLLTNTTSGETKQDNKDNDVVITLTNGQVTDLTVGGIPYTQLGTVGLSAQRLADSVKVSGDKLIINIGGTDKTTFGTANTDWNFDWDFGANYHVEFDAGVVANQTNASQTNAALTSNTTLNFTTVTPAGNAVGASSQIMQADGSLASGFIWHHGHIGDATGAGEIAMNFSVGSHALVQLVDGGNTKTTTTTGRVLLSGFSADDVLYMDNWGQMSMLTTSGVQTAVYTGSGNSLKRSLANSDGGTSVDVVFADYASTGYTAVTSLNGGDNALEAATRYNANVVIFG